MELPAWPARLPDYQTLSSPARVARLDEHVTKPAVGAFGLQGPLIFSCDPPGSLSMQPVFTP